MTDQAELLSIGEVAHRLGVTPKTIRRWEALGLIESTRTPRGQRRFARSEVERVLRSGQESV